MPEKDFKDNKRWQVVPNDRAYLLHAANYLVMSMILKMRPDDGIVTTLDSYEQESYVAALQFMTQEFKKGVRPDKSHLVQSDLETRHYDDIDIDLYDEDPSI